MTKDWIRGFLDKEGIQKEDLIKYLVRGLLQGLVQVMVHGLAQHLLQGRNLGNLNS